MATSELQLWLSFLLILWGALLFGGFVFGHPDTTRTRRMPAWTRMGSSLTLVIAAWGWFGLTAETPTATFGLWIAIGMTLGFVGDLFMARLIPLLKEPVIGGMGAFALGHVAYVIALLNYAAQAGVTGTTTRLIAWAIWLLVGALLWYLVVFRGRQPTTLHWLALPYALLLSSTAGVATGLALQAAGGWPIAIGAALFLFSDLIIAARLFNNVYFLLIDDVVWLLYGPGQMLIVFGASGLMYTWGGWFGPLF